MPSVARGLKVDSRGEGRRAYEVGIIWTEPYTADDMLIFVIWGKGISRKGSYIKESRARRENPGYIQRTFPLVFQSHTLKDRKKQWALLIKEMQGPRSAAGVRIICKQAFTEQI